MSDRKIILLCQTMKTQHMEIYGLKSLHVLKCVKIRNSSDKILTSLPVIEHLVNIFKLSLCLLRTDIFTFNKDTLRQLITRYL